MDVPKTMSKIRKITAWIFVGIMSAIFITSATLKFISLEDSIMVQSFFNYGLEDKLILIGIGELVSAILFLIPKTSSLGVLLLTALMGGTIAIHMSNGEMYFPQANILLLLWVANYLRNPEMLSSFFKK